MVGITSIPDLLLLTQRREYLWIATSCASAYQTNANAKMILGKTADMAILAGTSMNVDVI